MSRTKLMHVSEPLKPRPRKRQKTKQGNDRRRERYGVAKPVIWRRAGILSLLFCPLLQLSLDSRHEEAKAATEVIRHRVSLHRCITIFRAMLLCTFKSVIPHAQSFWRCKSHKLNALLIKCMLCLVWSGLVWSHLCLCRLVGGPASEYTVWQNSLLKRLEQSI